MAMYVEPNFRTKKAFKEAVGLGDRIEYYQVGPFGGNEPINGTIAVEGPHYPEPHSWYATAQVVDGIITKVS